MLPCTPPELNPLVIPSQDHFSDTAINKSDDSYYYLNDDFLFEREKSDSECESEEEVETSSFEEEIVIWAKQFLISTTAVDALLRLLKSRGHSFLPKSYKTLFNTPVTRDLIDVQPGKYFHFGFETGLKIQLQGLSEKTIIPSTLEIDFNVDGIPISKSSGSQFWPVLALLKNINTEVAPFVIGLYHGLTKPASASEFLKSFATEAKELMASGFNFKGTVYRILPRAYICDAPAKSFITGTKGNFFKIFIINLFYLS